MTASAEPRAAGGCCPAREGGDHRRRLVSEEAGVSRPPTEVGGAAAEEPRRAQLLPSRLQVVHVLRVLDVVLDMAVENRRRVGADDYDAADRRPRQGLGILFRL